MGRNNTNLATLVLKLSQHVISSSPIPRLSRRSFDDSGHANVPEFGVQYVVLPQAVQEMDAAVELVVLIEAWCDRELTCEGIFCLLSLPVRRACFVMTVDG